MLPRFALLCRFRTRSALEYGLRCNCDSDRDDRGGVKGPPDCDGTNMGVVSAANELFSMLSPVTV